MTVLVGLLVVPVLGFVLLRVGEQRGRQRAVFDGTPSAWVRLNHKQPVDSMSWSWIRTGRRNVPNASGLRIGGVIRPQGVSDDRYSIWIDREGQTPQTHVPVR